MALTADEATARVSDAGAELMLALPMDVFTRWKIVSAADEILVVMLAEELLLASTRAIVPAMSPRCATTDVTVEVMTARTVGGGNGGGTGGRGGLGGGSGGGGGGGAGGDGDVGGKGGKGGGIGGGCGDGGGDGTTMLGGCVTTAVILYPAADSAAANDAMTPEGPSAAAAACSVDPFGGTAANVSSTAVTGADTVIPVAGTPPSCIAPSKLPSARSRCRWREEERLATHAARGERSP